MTIEKNSHKAGAKNRGAGRGDGCGACRILIVDDAKSIRDLFLQIISFGLPNCRVDVAVSGEEAIEVFRNGWHSVILLDQKMPTMDGEDVFKAIETMCRQADRAMPSVVFATGFTPSEGINQIVKANPAHGLLRKPVPVKTLIEAIQSRLPQ